MEVIPFDLYRMFIGEQPPLFLLEIIFRTFVMYAYTLFAIRFIGKRGMGQMTPFEFVVIIVLGSAVGDPMLYDDVPLLHGMMVVTVIVILHKILNSLTNRSSRVEESIESKTAQLIKNGEIIPGSLEAEGMSLQEFLMQLRMQGIKNTGEVQCAFLEPSGSISLFKYEKADCKEGKSTFPETLTNDTKK